MLKSQFFKLCRSSSPHATRWPFIIILLFLKLPIIIHLVDIHFWLMSSTQSSASWLSIFSISFSFFFFFLHQSQLLLVLVQTWAKLYVLDNLLHLLLGAETSIDQHDPNWYKLDFCFPLLVYIQPIYYPVDFGSVHIIFPLFPLITSVHVLFHSCMDFICYLSIPYLEVHVE